jgi:hypothetical protein
MITADSLRFREYGHGLWPFTVVASRVHILAGDSWLVTTTGGGQGLVAGNLTSEQIVDDNEGTLNELLIAVSEAWPGLVLSRPQRSVHARPSAKDVANIILYHLVGTYATVLDAVIESFQNRENTYLAGWHGRDDISVGWGAFEVAQSTDQLTFSSDLFRLREVAHFLARTTGDLARQPQQSEKLRFSPTTYGRGIVEGIDHRLYQTYQRLQWFQTELRSAFELLNSFGAHYQLQLSVAQQELAAKQQKLSARQQERADRLQRLVGYITALVLVPTLVASVLGSLPGIYEQNSFSRAWLVLGATAASALLSGLGVLLYNRRASRHEQRDGRA